MIRTRVGYSGGDKENPTYHNLGDHTETIEIDFDPTVISYEDLLNVFWQEHDPTSLNWSRQYRNAVFYHSEEQKKLAEHYKAKLDGSGAFRAPIVTEISPYTSFYPAEQYHQDFYERNPRQRYCASVIRPKMKKLGLE